MTKKYDVIVIGGGHNGLVAATTLAKENKRVLVLEKRAVLGGIAAGEEFYPGFTSAGLLHDTSEIRGSVIKALDLEKFGLKYRNARPTYSILSKEGGCVHLDPDVDKAANEPTAHPVPHRHGQETPRHTGQPVQGIHTEVFR